MSELSKRQKKHIEERRARRRDRKRLAEHIVEMNRGDANYACWVTSRRAPFDATRRQRKAYRRSWTLVGENRPADTRRMRRAEWATRGHDRPMWEPKEKIPAIPFAIYRAIQKAANRKSAAQRAHGWLLSRVGAR